MVAAAITCFGNMAEAAGSLWEGQAESRPGLVLGKIEWVWCSVGLPKQWFKGSDAWAFMVNWRDDVVDAGGEVREEDDGPAEERYDGVGSWD